jgi:CRISPR-associated protein Csb2
VPTLKLRFPAGRFHATPWGHHVNEGLVEWPPSPWRLLRAFIACGFATQNWSKIPPDARRLIDKLAEVLPSYRLPPASSAHSRHYMPVGVLGKGREKTTLVFDTWADVGAGEILVHWPCKLDWNDASLLKRLADALGYVGRSESWVEAELIAGDSLTVDQFNAFPSGDDGPPGREYEQVSLMAAIPPASYVAWHGSQVDAALAAFPLPGGERKPSAKLLKDRERAVAPYPPDLVACLTQDTAWWKGHGWSQPPGSRRVLYWRRRDSLQVGVPQLPRAPEHHRVTTMVLAITTASGNRSALPPRTRTLPQAELFHRAIVGRVGNGALVDCPELTGRGEHGRPLRADHGHAHTIPVDLDGDGHLDHLIVYAPMGLGALAQRSIRNLRRTWTKGGAGDLQLAVVGSGDLEILRCLPPPLRRQVDALLGPPEGTRSWMSDTPFVFPRFLKPQGKNAILGQINDELATRGLPLIERADVDEDLTRTLRHHIRRRNHGGAPPVDTGYGLRLTFPERVRGPLMLGYASHYGLGRFRAVVD